MLKFVTVVFTLIFSGLVFATVTDESDRELFRATTLVQRTYWQFHLAAEACSKVDTFGGRDQILNRMTAWKQKNDSLYKATIFVEREKFGGLIYPEIRKKLDEAHNESHQKFSEKFQKAWSVEGSDKRSTFCESVLERLQSSAGRNISDMLPAESKLINGANLEASSREVCDLVADSGSYIAMKYVTDTKKEDAVVSAAKYASSKQTEGDEVERQRLLPAVLGPIATTIYSESALDQNGANEYAYWRCYLPTVVTYTAEIDRNLIEGVLACKNSKPSLATQCVNSKVKSILEGASASNRSAERLPKQTRVYFVPKRPTKDAK